MKLINKLIESKLVLILQALVSLVLCFVTFQLNVLPLRYVLILLAALVLLWIIMYFFTRMPKKLPRHAKKPVRPYIGKVISLLLTIAMMIGSGLLMKTNGTISDMTGKSEKTTLIALVVMKDSKYSKVNDVDGKKIGVNTQVNADKVKEGISQLKKKISYTQKDYTDFEKLSNDLYAGKTDAILVDYAYEAVMETYHEDFESKTEILWKYEITEEVENTAANKDVTKDTFNIFISGVDSRGKVSATSRSDVNLIVTVNPKTKQILMTSIPRDYYVTLANLGKKDKLTHAGLFGTENSEKTIENFMGIDIDYNARVNFQSLIKIVDALGGVDVYSDKAFSPWTDRSIYIKKGMIHMNGKMALAFSRERHAYASGDRHRAANQQAVLKAIIKKASSPSVITGYSDLLDAVDGCFQTNMSADDITSLAKMQIDDGGSWTFQQSILSGSGKLMKGGAMMPNVALYYTVPNESSVKKNANYIQQMLDGQEITVDAADGKAAA